MNFFVLKIKINGIKNIDKPIELNFYKNNLTKNLKDIEKYHVKSIYGPNGAGKTAIMKAIDIFKNLMIYDDYITIENTQPNLINLINQTEEKFSISVIYVILDDNNNVLGVYSSYVCLTKNNGRILISEEKLSKLRGKNLLNNEKYNILYEVVNGELKNINTKYNKKIINLINNATHNLLSRQTFISTVTNILIKNDDFIKLDKNFSLDMLTLAVFCRSINVVLQDTDENYINIETVRESLKIIYKLQNKLDDDILLGKMLSENRITKDSIETVSRKNYDNYVKWVKNLKSFIKVFKNDLEDIEIKKVDNGEFYECELILVYSNGVKINRKYESTGIKKIINLYSALSNLNNGEIVFIDEFDANIHDVLLNKIVEYVIKYAKGQLIFTTHNVGLMDILKVNNLSIDFLSPNSQIVPWVKNGNYSPSNLYKKGLINLSPFNIESFDFLGVFGDEENE